MALIKLNNRAVKDATAFGSITSLGSLTFISKQTASSSASISFTSGIDSTYKEYMFVFNNIHPQTDIVDLQFNLSTDGGSNYNVTKTSTSFRAYHSESDSVANLNYQVDEDLAQSTAYQKFFGSSGVGNDDDESASGYLHLFNPSDTTYVKHYIANFNYYHASSRSNNTFTAGYANTTSAINAIDFQFSSGNIDAGTISLFGIA